MSGGEYLTASLSDETADADCALDALRAQPESTGSVAVIGHSVGATVAMRLARAARPPDAYVFLAGAATPGEQVMAWQSRRIAATLPVPWRWFRRTLERRQAADRARLLASTGATLHVRGQDLPAHWFREYMAYDPAADLATIDRPVLAVTGAKDIQVDPADVAAIGRMVTGPFDGETPDDLTHVLRRDQHPPGLHRYAGQLSVPVDADLVERVATGPRRSCRDGFPELKVSPTAGQSQPERASHCAYGPRPPWSRLLTNRRRVPSDSGPAAAPTPPPAPPRLTVDTMSKAIGSTTPDGLTAAPGLVT